MLKQLFIIPIAICVSVLSKAQIQFGGQVLGSASIATISPDPTPQISFKPIPFLGGGFFVQIPLVKSIHTRVGLGYLQSGFIQKWVDNQGGFNIDLETTAMIHNAWAPLEIAIPISIGSGKLTPTIGGSALYAISGTLKNKGNINGTLPITPDEKIKFGSNVDDNFKPLNYTANIGLGYLMSSGLEIKAGFMLGLPNLANDAVISYKNNFATVGVAYFINKESL
jgi:hypothetical protein